MTTDIILGIIAVLGPIISGVWSYKSAVKKSELNLEAVKDKNKSDIESIRIQTDNELEKIREQALAEAKLHEDKAKTNLATKQFDNPVVQEKMGNAVGSLVEKMLEKEFGKHFDDKK